MSDPQRQADDFWSAMTTPGLQEAIVAGVLLRRGSRVRLRPRPGGDVFDLALAGRTAVVEGIDEDDAGTPHFAVVVDDDPGRALGEDRQIGHRFFFRADEIEPLGEAPMPARVLVAGIGNIFFGDDAFGVAVAQRLAARPPRAGVDVVDFGIRGMDLAYALQERYEVAILVDASPRGEPPGMLSVIDALADEGPAAVPDAHGMDPARVLRLARTLGGLPRRVLLVACEPAAGELDPGMALSEPVRQAVDEAVLLIEAIVEELLAPPAAPTDTTKEDDR
jgi:hydrogenase maturation protease